MDALAMLQGSSGLEVVGWGIMYFNASLYKSMNADSAPTNYTIQWDLSESNLFPEPETKTPFIGYNNPLSFKPSIPWKYLSLTANTSVTPTNDMDPEYYGVDHLQGVCTYRRSGYVQHLYNSYGPAISKLYGISDRDFGTVYLSYVGFGISQITGSAATILANLPSACGTFHYTVTACAILYN